MTTHIDDILAAINDSPLSASAKEKLAERARGAKPEELYQVLSEIEDELDAAEIALLKSDPATSSAVDAALADAAQETAHAETAFNEEMSAIESDLKKLNEDIGVEIDGIAQAEAKKALG